LIINLITTMLKPVSD